MDDYALEITLRSMGKACFVKYYEHADDPALPDRMKEAEPYTYKSCQSRASCLRRIIRHGRDRDALANIANSGKLDMETRQKAAALLAQDRPGPSAGGAALAMNDQQLMTTLRAVGMACFVRYYEYAYDASLPQRIRNADGYTPASCQTRASGISSIIVRDGRGKEALAIIANADKVKPEARKMAAALLARL